MRPIAAAPAKLPESSGLHFSGHSAGLLKASGPQPTSPKASGLTSSSAGSSVGPSAATFIAPSKAGAAKPAAVAVTPTFASDKQPHAHPPEPRMPKTPPHNTPTPRPKPDGWPHSK